MNINYKISLSSPTDKRKIKQPFSRAFYFLFFSSFPCFIFFFHVSIYLFILVLMKISPRWAEISIYFQFLNCRTKFPLISQTPPPPSNLDRVFGHFLHLCLFQHLIYSLKQLSEKSYIVNYFQLLNGLKINCMSGNVQ